MKGSHASHISTLLLPHILSLFYQTYLPQNLHEETPSSHLRQFVLELPHVSSDELGADV